MKKALRRLTLHNFQSHEDTILDLSTGVNVIVGPSDVGKTSLIRALRWLYYNQPRGTGFIRMGTSECWVEVETEDHIIVRRYRNEAGRKNGYSLVLPGQEPMLFEKHGSTVPDEIKQALGVEEMMIDQDAVLNLNIAYQLEGAFLLETPGTTRAKAIGRLGNAHIVDAAQREIQKDLRGISQEIEKSKGQLAAEEKLLDNYRHLTDWADRIGQLEKIFARRESIESRQSQLTALKSGYEKTRSGLAGLQPTLLKLRGIEAAEKHLEELKAAGYRADTLTSLQQQHQVKSMESQRYDRLLEDTRPLPTVSVLLNRLHELLTKIKIYHEIKQRLSDVHVHLQQAETIIAASDELEAANAKLVSCRSKQDMVLVYQQLYRDWEAKRQRWIEADRQVVAGRHLPQAEAALDELVRLREMGVSLNEKWRTYRQRREQLRQATGQVGALAGYEHTETLMNRIKHGDQLLTELNDLHRRRQASRQAITQSRERIMMLEAGYARDSEEYLQCLQGLGQCPVCHGNIDEKHLQELKKQLEEEWRGE